MPRTAEKQDAPEIQHKKGCPADRIESFEADRPSGEKVVISRCVDCGEFGIDDKE